MSKKQKLKKDRIPEISLSQEESGELQMILDRLEVQDPEGESFTICLQSLRESLKGRENLVAALLERLGRTPTPVGFKTVVALQGLVESTRFVRIVKRARYRFVQAGFSLPPEVSTGEAVVLVHGEARESVAHMSAAREAFWFISALIHEPTYPEPFSVAVFPHPGFASIEIRIVEGSPKAYKQLLSNISGKLSFKPCPIPVWHAARLFFELLELSREKFLSQEGEMARRLFLPFHDPNRPPYAHTLLPALENPERDIRHIDVKTVMDRALSGWLLFGKETVEPYHQKLQDLDRPLLVVPREIQEERAADVLRSAAEALCSGEARSFYRRSFEEVAMYLKLSGEEDAALSVWTVAQHLAGEESAAENPVIYQLVATSIQHHWPQYKEAARGGARSAPFQETDSGLIVLK